MALADRAELAVRLTLDSRGFTGSIKSAKSALSSFDKATSNTQRALGRTGANLQRLGTIAAVGAAGGLIYAVKAAADFEAQLLTINTIARETTDGLGGTTDGLDRIGQGIRKIASETGTPLEDLTQGYYDLLSAGIGAADAQGVLEAANTLAIGGLATTAQTVDLLTTAINAYGQDASQASRDADIFAKAIELGKVTADEIAASFSAVAPVAAQQGIEIEEIAAAYAALTAQGVPAAEVTTQMQRAIVELLDPSKDLINLQDKLGVSFLQIAEDEGLVVALQRMRDAVGDDDAAFKALFGRIEGYKFALQTTGPQQEIYNRALEEMNVLLAEGTAADQAAERMKGLEKQLEILGANFQGIGITIGTALLPQITPLAQKLNTFLTENQGKVEAFGKDLAGAFTAVGKAAMEIPWGEIKAGLQTVVDVAKVAFGAFMALPPEFKKLLVGGLVINKLTGGFTDGLVTGIGKDVFGAAFNKLLTGSVFGRGATPANPLFVSAVGGLGGVPGVAPTTTGGKLLNVISKVMIVGMVAEVASLISAPIVEFGKQVSTMLPFQTERENFGAMWQEWRDSAPWPFGQEGAPAWAGGTTPPKDVVPGPKNQPVPNAVGSPDDRSVLAAVAANTALTNAKLESNRLAIASAMTQASIAATAAGQAAAAAIRDKNFNVTVTNVNNVAVTVRDIARKVSVSTRLGYVAQ